MKQWLLTVASLDVGVLGKKLKEIATELRHYPSSWQVLQLREFKALCEWPSFGVFMSPVKDYLLSYLKDPSPSVLKILLQWICFLTRVTLTTGFDQSVDGFLVTEKRLKDLEISPLWDELRDLLHPIALRYHPTSFRPKLSNGANANVPSQLGIWGKVVHGWGFSNLQRYLLWKKGIPTSREEEVECEPCAKVIFVPKGIDSQRTICEEPVSSMFLQQGILESIDDWFSTDIELKRYISLHDQSQQQILAQQASDYLNVATIDLSEASDSVSFRLAEYVFNDTILWEDISLSRTKLALLPTGEVIELNKFAPMGSAVNFPIECLIFTGIALLGCRRCGVHPRLGVYGDDMIIPLEAEEEIESLLSHFGFLLNSKKTFWGTERFKESCGGEYMDGVDVTPTYISRKFSASVSSEPTLLSTYTSMANTFFQKHLHTARRALLSLLILPNFPGVYFNYTAELGLQSLQATNFHLRYRWNKSLQEYEVKSQYLSMSESFVSDDDVRYFLTLIQYSRCTRSSLLFPQDRLLVELPLPKALVKWHWVVDPGYHPLT
jgi:hypothetical protein